jgi:hypothetical protein
LVKTWHAPSVISGELAQAHNLNFACLPILSADLDAPQLQHGPRRSVRLKRNGKRRQARESWRGWRFRLFRRSTGRYSLLVCGLIALTTSLPVRFNVRIERGKVPRLAGRKLLACVLLLFPRNFAVRASIEEVARPAGRER